MTIKIEDGLYFFDGVETEQDLVAEWSDEAEAAPEPASPAKRFTVTVFWDSGHDATRRDTLTDVTAHYIDDGFLRVEQADGSAYKFALQHVRCYSVAGATPE